MNAHVFAPSTGHAVYAPSAMSRILPCPPSAKLARGLPERVTEKATEGTRVHAVFDKHMRAGTLPPPLQPWVVRDETTRNNMTDYEVVGYGRAYVQGLGAGKLLHEHKVFLMSGVWGTLDLGHIADVITIFDFKNGGWDVQARGNKQLLTYAGTFLKDYPGVQHFRLVIFQPNSWGKDEMFDQWVHTRAEVEAHVAEVAAAVAYDGPPKPGPHCRWCPAFGVCPAMAHDAGFLVGAMSRIDMLSAEELTRMLRLVRSFADMKEHMEERLTGMLKTLQGRGEKFPEGTALKQGRKWRSYNNSAHAAETLWRLHGPKGVKPVGVAEAERLGPEAKAYVAIGTHKPEGDWRASY